MRKANDLLARTLRAPDLATRFSLTQWDLLVRQARQAGLLARLQDRFSHQALLKTIPQPVRWHFDAAAALAHKQQIAVRWEVGQIRDALARHAPEVPVQEVARLDTGAMSQVVAHARSLARPGDVVLLAPAAASMDCFRDYAQRGDLFAAAVHQLAVGELA